DAHNKSERPLIKRLYRVFLRWWSWGIPGYNGILAREPFPAVSSDNRRCSISKPSEAATSCRSAPLNDESSGFSGYKSISNDKRPLGTLLPDRRQTRK